MTKRLCVCMTEKTQQNCIDFVSACDSDIIEHRMDFMDHITGFKEIYSASDIPVIATCRSLDMGGNFVGKESTRIALLSDAISQGASFVDIEFETAKEYQSRIKAAALEYNCQLIISKHYIKQAPSFSDLVKLIDRMKDSGADILKIVVTPKSIEDCGRILQLYSLQHQNIPLIAFAMGHLGRFTRVSALFLGAPFMYVSQDSGDEAASGQISLSAMRAIVRVLI